MYFISPPSPLLYWWWNFGDMKTQLHFFVAWVQLHQKLKLRTTMYLRRQFEAATSCLLACSRGLPASIFTPFSVFHSPKHGGIVIALPIPFGMSKARYVKNVRYKPPVLSLTIRTPLPEASLLFTNRTLHEIKLTPNPSLFSSKGVDISISVPGEPEKLVVAGE